MSNDSVKPNIVVVCHAYQPHNQNRAVLDRIVNNCYLPVANMLEENPEAKITLNFNASLSELLENDYSIVIEKFANLAKRGQIEFLESGAYHPILPLLSEKEAQYQIKLNHSMNMRIFGNIWHPIGFWPPELAVSEWLLSLIDSFGYQYSMIPEIAIGSNNGYPNPLIGKIPQHKAIPDLALIYRNREVSNNISFRWYKSINDLNTHFKSLFAQQAQQAALIVATDLETFGEHHKGYEEFLSQILIKNNALTVSEILSYPKEELEEFQESSWSTSQEDIYRSIPFPLWAYPGNSIHEILNIHSTILSEALNFLLTVYHDENIEVRRAMKAVAKAQYSCQTWWASTKDHFSKKLILDGFEAQKKSLEIILRVLGTKYPHSIILAISNQLEERLQRTLQRMR
jgi:predicted glycosyl hydrolase (DUF1957 family)